MATSNKRDVELGIAVQTTGTEEIQKLAADVRALAAQGGDAAPEFTRLADAIDKIAEQSSALAALAKLRAEIEALSAAQVEAAGKAKPLADKYRELEAAAKEAANGARTAKQAEVDSKTAYDDKRLALKLLKLETDAAGKANDTYKANVKSLGQEIAALEADYRRARAASTAASAASKDAAAAQKEAAAAYRESQAALQASNKALEARQGDLKAAEAAVEALGVATDDLAAAEQRLRREFQESQASAKSFQASVVALARAQKELAAQDDFDKVSADLARLRSNADMTKVVAELERVEQAERELAAQSKLAAEALERTFSLTGIRSAATIRAEIEKVNAALLSLSRDARVSGSEFDRAFAAGQEKIKALNTELAKTPGQIEKAGAATNFLRQSLQQLAAIYGGVELGTKFFEATTQIETLRRTLTLIAGDSKLATEQIQFLRDTANFTGQSFSQLAQDFTTFTAATTKSGVSLRESNELFRSVTNAAGQLGLSTQRTGLIITALSQIASKGKVSLEELQGQLGESLPGALAVTAKGLGITTTELTKLVETGKLSAQDFFPAFKKGVDEAFGGDATKRVETLGAAFNRFKNALTKLSQKAADTSAYTALRTVLNSLADNMETVASATYSAIKAYTAFKAIDIARTFLGLRQATEAVTVAKVRDAEVEVAKTAATRAATTATVADTAAIVANTAATRAATLAKAGLGTATAAASVGFEKIVTGAQNAASKVGSLAGALGGPLGIALTGAFAFSEQLGNGLAKLAARFTGVLGTLEKNEAALKKVAEAEAAAAKAAEERAKAVTEGYVKILVSYQKDLDAAEKRVKISELQVKSTNEEADASVRLASLIGKETVTKAAATAAAEKRQAAVENQLRAQREEVNLLQAQLVALQKAAGAEETWSAARRQQFTEMQQQIDRKKADAEVTRQQGRELAAVTQAAKQAQAAYRDNSESLDEFKDAVVDARKNYEFMEKAFKDGLATQESVEKSALALASAQGLLEDAYDDATKAIKRRGEALRESAGLAQQDLEIQRRRTEIDLRLAESTGQYTDKLQAGIAAKELDIKQSNLKIATAEKEAALLREEAALLQQRLVQGDPLYEQKKREIDQILNAAAAKTKEGLIERENLRGLNTELGLLDGTLYQGAKGFSEIGDAAEAAAKQLDVFTAAGIRARNAAVKSTIGGSTYERNEDGSLQSGFGQGGYQIGANGQKVAPGEFFAIDTTIRKGLDANGNMIYGRYNEGRGSNASGTLQVRGNGAAPGRFPTKTVNINLGTKSAQVETSDVNSLLSVLKAAQGVGG